MQKRHLGWMGLVCSSLLGCSQIGPHGIAVEQPSYREIINKNKQQEILINLVKLKYNDDIGFLDISSISSTNSLEIRAGYELSITDALSMALPSKSQTRNHTQAGRYTPGITYAEKPIITYSPLNGQKFTKKLLSPLPLYSVYLLVRSGWSIDQIFRLLLQEANEVENASGSSAVTTTHVPPFEEFKKGTAALRELQIMDAIRFDYLRTKGEEVLILHIKPRFNNSAAANTFRKVFHIKSTKPDLLIAEYNPVSKIKVDIHIEIRSLLGVFYFLSDAVYVPKSHIKQGLVTVTRYPDGKIFNWYTITKGELSIKSQAKKPSDVSVSVFYRNYWYFIADNDITSKSTLAVLNQLFELTVDDKRETPTTLSLSV